ncbi:BURP domain-containing protein 12-like isoform X2 [Phragmites australis]|uniref:BURP domain-containing protein 12-like isoform X2 n=1 Tax=Phragmites australis TaxID=29695 RepID=UPI002D79F29A|nr:BURP domain-containing protein 12-like isoform X2 [Phragmites australis]
MAAIVSLVSLLLVTGAGGTRHGNLAPAVAVRPAAPSRTMAPMEYWQAVLPETPMPQAIHDVLTQSTVHVSLDDMSMVDLENVHTVQNGHSQRPNFVKGLQKIGKSSDVRRILQKYGLYFEQEQKVLKLKGVKNYIFLYGSQGDEDSRKVTMAYGSHGEEDPRKATVSYESQGDDDSKKVTTTYGSHSEEDQRKVTVSYGSQGDEDSIRKVTTAYGSSGEEDPRKVTVSYGSQSDEDSRKITTAYGSRGEEDLTKVSMLYGSQGNEESRKITMAYGSGGEKDPKKVTMAYGSCGEEDPWKVTVSYESQGDEDSRKVTTTYGSHGEEYQRKATMSYGSQGDEDSIRKVTTTYGSRGEEDPRKVTVSYGSQRDEDSRKTTTAYDSRGEKDLTKLSMLYGTQGNKDSRNIAMAYGSGGEEDPKKVTVSYRSQGYLKEGISYESQYGKDLKKVNNNMKMSMPYVPLDEQHTTISNNQQTISERSAASKGDMHDHAHSHSNGNKRLADVFFLHDVLRPGSVITPTIPLTTSLPSLLPRHVADTIPFSTERFADILAMFAPASLAMAGEIRWTIDTCENQRPLTGEKVGCATSLESLAELPATLLGSRNIHAFSADMPIDPEGTAALRGTYNLTAVRKLSESLESVTCHDMTYPYAVFYCHTANPVEMYMVTLVAKDGGAPAMEVLAVCHLDTSQWNPKNPFFMVHNLKPGDVALCHFLSKLSTIWVLAGEQGDAHAW